MSGGPKSIPWLSGHLLEFWLGFFSNSGGVSAGSQAVFLMFR